MNTNETIQTKGDTLVNESTITMSAIDSRVLESIQTFGLDAALSRAAHDAASGDDFMYRMAIHYGTSKGLFTLPENEKGSYPSNDDRVKAALNVVSVQSTNSQRKHFGKCLRYAWIVQSLGYAPLDFPSFPSLAKVAKPPKTVAVSLEQDAINGAAIEAYHAAKEAEAAKVEELKVEAAKVEELKVEAAKVEAEAKAVHIKAEAAKAEADASIQVLRNALQGALYGTAEQRKGLRAEYPKV